MAAKRRRTTTSKSSKRPKKAKSTSSAPLTRDSSTKTTIQYSALLNIPSELLTHILSFLLVRNEHEPFLLRSAKERRWRNEICKLVDIEVPGQWRSWVNYNEMESAVKAITSSCKSNLLITLLVSRDFYFAGVAAFYGGNTFRFESTANLLRLAKKLDVDRRRHISKVMITRDINGDHKELLPSGAPSVEHDPAALYAAVDRLPALKVVIFDFTLGGSAPPFVWQRLRSHATVLKEICVEISDKVSFAVDGKIVDTKTWAVAK